MLAATQVILNATVVTLLVSVAVPALTAAVTHLKASNWIKQGATLALSTGVAALTTATLADGTAVVSWATGTNALLGFLSATVAYLAAYKPKELNAVILPLKGLGKPKADLADAA